MYIYYRYATGFVPTSIPGAPILNVALAPLPFASPGIALYNII